MNTVHPALPAPHDLLVTQEDGYEQLEFRAPDHPDIVTFVSRNEGESLWRLDINLPVDFGLRSDDPARCRARNLAAARVAVQAALCCLTFNGAPLAVSKEADR